MSASDEGSHQDRDTSESVPPPGAAGGAGSRVMVKAVWWLIASLKTKRNLVQQRRQKVADHSGQDICKKPCTGMLILCAHTQWQTSARFFFPLSDLTKDSVYQFVCFAELYDGEQDWSRPVAHPPLHHLLVVVFPVANLWVSRLFLCEFWSTDQQTKVEQIRDDSWRRPRQRTERCRGRKFMAWNCWQRNDESVVVLFSLPPFDLSEETCTVCTRGPW